MPKGTKLPADVSFELLPDEKSAKSDYKATLFRGEKELQSENTVLGTLRMPADLALAITNTKAIATLRVSDDGMMAVTMKHPKSGEVHSIEVSLVDK